MLQQSSPFHSVMVRISLLPFFKDYGSSLPPPFPVYWDESCTKMEKKSKSIRVDRPPFKYKILLMLSGGRIWEARSMIRGAMGYSAPLLFSLSYEDLVSQQYQQYPIYLAQVAPTISIKLRKPSSSKLGTSSGPGWTEVGKSSGSSSKIVKPMENKPFLAPNSGFIVTYESEDSSELLEKDGAVDPNMATAQAMPNVALHSAGCVSVTFDAINVTEQAAPLPTEVLTAVAEMSQAPDLAPTQTHSEAQPKTVVTPEVPLSPEPSFPEEKVDYRDSPPLEQEYYEAEEDEEEEEEEDSEEDENYMEIEHAQGVEDHGFNMISDEEVATLPPITMFTTEELEKFLDGPDYGFPMPAKPTDSPTLSMNNSIPSSSSMIRKLDDLGVTTGDTTDSHSGKRKVKEGTLDTASSGLLGTKKPRR